MADVELTVPAPNEEAEEEAKKIGRDERETFSKITKEQPHDEKAQKDFVAAKVQMARSHPGLSNEHRRKAVADIAARLGGKPDELEKDTPPVPGGVGYGMFFNSSFRAAFAQGTSINFQIVCPTTIGGNLSNWFYLTSMNRAGRGIEAFISYYAQQQMRFKVFDWARTDHWQIDIPFSSLGNYLTNVSAHGVTYQTVNVWNTTVQIASGTWRNEALLWNRALGRWDLIYRYDYPATLAQQNSGYTGTWGPIVETFQASHTGTQPVGFLGTQLQARNSSGVWGSWGLLGSSQSYIRNDNQGFSVRFLDPNYAFVVKS